MSARSFVLRVCVAAVLLGGCTQQAQGSFSVTLQWMGSPPTFNPAVYLFGRVEERDVSPSTPGTVLATVGPVAFTGASVSVNFPTVPNGSNRVVIAELHTAQDATSQVLYYGASEPFSLTAGQNTVVPVLLSLQPVPGSGADSISVRSTGAAGYVNTATVTLLLGTNTGTSVKLGNQLADVDGAAPVALSGLTSGQATLPGWNLNTGLPSGGCDVTTSAAGCPRHVYARFIDANGYASPVVSADVILDELAPTLTSVSEAPAIATTGDVITIAVVPSEPLSGILPAVTSSGTTTTLTLAAGAHSPDVFTHAVTSADTSASYSVTFKLTDLAGNVAAAAPTPPIAFTIDNVVPTITNLQVLDGSGTPATQFSAVTGFNSLVVSFDWSMSEAPASLSVTLGGTPLTCTPPASASQPFECLHTVTASDPEGPVAIEVVASDAAGHQVSTSATVTLDFTPPSLAGSTAAPALAYLGQVEALLITPSEPLGMAPVLAVTPGLLSFTSTTTQETFEYTARIPSTDPNGTLATSYTTTVELVDVVGNSANLTGPGFAVTDSSPITSPIIPAITNVAVAGGQGPSSSVFSAVGGFNQVTVSGQWDSGSTTSRGATSLTLSVGGNSGSCQLGNTSGTPPYAFTCTYTVTGSEPQGANLVTIQGTNSAQITATAGAAVTFDFTPPSLLNAPTAQTLPYGVGQQISFTLEPSEALASGFPVIHVSPSGTGSPGFTQTGLTYTHTVSPSDHAGTFTIQWTLQDAVGNESAPLPTSALSVTLDTTIPTVSITSGAGATYSRVSGFSLVSLGALVSEAGTVVSAKVGTSPMHCTAQSNPLDVICTYQIVAGDTQGTKLVTVQTLASSGNTGTANTTVTYDFTPPTLIAGPAIAYVPGAGNVLPVVTAAAVNTVVQVSFAASEPLGVAPTVALASPGLTFAQTIAAGSSYVFSATMTTPGSPADGTYGLSIVVTDLVGNSSTLAPGSPTVQIDTTPPAAPATGTANAVTYSRTPWGSTATGGVPAFSLTGAASAATAASSVVVYDGADIATANEIGRGTVSANGAFQVALAGPDRVSIYVASADEAGNVSSPVGVHDVTWTASFDGKVAGSPASNPNVLTAATDLELTTDLFESALLLGPLTQDPTTSGEPASYGTLAAAGGKAISTTAATTLWRDPTPSNAFPPSGAYVSMAFDSARGRSVVFGGQTALQPTAATWEFDGSIWTYANPGGVTPAARYSAATVYDSARGRTLLFGGDTGAQFLGDTWEWDGAAWTQPAGAQGISPASRGEAALAYDSGRGRTVLFGGSSAGGVLNDTWEWDGSSWIDVALNGATGSPPPRSAHSLVYDAARQVTVLFGGSDANGDPLGDMWTWNGSTWSVVTQGAGPSPRYGHAMVYDRLAGNSLLFGGFDGSEQQGDTWIWNGSIWASISPLQAPSSRLGHGMTYDSVRGRTVLFGGNNGEQNVDEAWEWNGSNWSNITPSASTPGQRTQVAMAYDSNDDYAVLFGGDAGGATGDTWAWNGFAWATPFNEGQAPPARYGNSMAYDLGNQESVMFGGFDGTNFLSDTWLWTGGAWVSGTPAGNGSPPGRWGAALAYDSQRGVTVLFGGTGASGALGDTWEWDGGAGTWSAITPSGLSPSPRSGLAMAYDSANQVTVLFGGTDATGALNDTWTWTGSTWTQITPLAAVPPARTGHALAFDATRGRTMLFGGLATDALNDTWEWDGSSWFNVTSSGATPAARSGHALVYDSTRNCLVAFGGEVTASIDGTQQTASLGDVWEAPTDVARRAGQVLQFSFAAAGETAATLGSISITASADGTGNTLVIPGDGVATPGVTLAAWNAEAGAWHPLPNATNMVTTPGGLTYATGSPAEAASYLIDRPQSINFALYTTDGRGNGETAPQATVGYAELTVSYSR